MLHDLFDPLIITTGFRFIQTQLIEGFAVNVKTQLQVDLTLLQGSREQGYESEKQDGEFHASGGGSGEISPSTCVA